MAGGSPLDVLRAVRLDGAYFYRVEASAPWSYFTEGASDLVPRVMPGAEHLISYHILLTGSCWAGIAGEEQILMRPGDVVVFPHGDAHLMSSNEGLGAAPRAKAERPRSFRPTSSSAMALIATPFVCGFLGWDARPFNPLLASLPRRLHVPGATA